MLLCSTWGLNCGTALAQLYPKFQILPLYRPDIQSGLEKQLQKRQRCWNQKFAYVSISIYIVTFTEMQNNSSLLLKYNRFEASISWQSVTLINIEELFKQLEFPQVRHKKAKPGKNSLFHNSEWVTISLLPNLLDMVYWSRMHFSTSNSIPSCYNPTAQIFSVLHIYITW